MGTVQQFGQRLARAAVALFVLTGLALTSFLLLGIGLVLAVLLWIRALFVPVRRRPGSSEAEIVQGEAVKPPTSSTARELERFRGSIREFFAQRG